jgi:hypothetical protein
MTLRSVVEDAQTLGHLRARGTNADIEEKLAQYLSHG